MLETLKSKLPSPLRGALRWTQDVLFGYRLYLWSKYGVNKSKGLPDAPWSNAVLRNRQEWENSVKQVKALGLPLSIDLPKNWDSLAALSSILASTDRKAAVLDAGAETYSVILPWLYLYGYRDLIGINPVFSKPLARGSICFEHGDITQTRFENNTFDAITCMSVIEHGVNLELYFKEIARILKPKGLLITSTDYYSDLIDTQGKVAYGVPVHIFCQEEILSVLNIARNYGLELTSEIDLDCQEKPVRWAQYDLDYTFLTFTLQKI